MSEQEVHAKVSAAYTEALRDSQKHARGGCCGGTSAAAALAGYGGEREAHPEAAAASFGCGNPLAFAAVKPGQTVLDLGSGAGLDLLIAAERVGASGRVIGVDMTDAMIEAAREAARRAGHANVEVRKGLIEQLPVADASVDWVISNCVINLSPSKEKVFREIARVLKPGGRMNVSDIVVEGLPTWVREHPASLSSCVAGAISESDYLAGLRAAGLVDVAVEDRLVYDAEQLHAIVESDLDKLGVDQEVLQTAVGEASGKVWSARIVARKPARARQQAPGAEPLDGKEKTLIALAAAVGGGCRTCAQGLYSIAGSAGASEQELERAFAWGLRQRDEATRVMREKAAELLGRAPGSPPFETATAGRIHLLSQLAASVAANSSPDALPLMHSARSLGTTESEIGVALGIARTIRAKAQGFSDAELGDSHAEVDEGADCPCS